MAIAIPAILVSPPLALIGAFNQEKTLVGDFSVIVKTDRSFAALHLTYPITSEATGCGPVLGRCPGRGRLGAAAGVCRATGGTLPCSWRPARSVQYSTVQ